MDVVKYYKITGNVREIRKIFLKKIAEDFNVSYTSAEYNYAVDKDKYRQGFINLEIDKDNDFLDSIFFHVEGYGYYIQGDFTASNITVALESRIIKVKSLESSNIASSNDYSKGIGFAYKDGVRNCAFFIKRYGSGEPYSYFIALIKNSTAKNLDDREVTVFYAESLFEEHKEIRCDVKKLRNELIETIDAPEIAQLVESIFDGDNISADKFDDLEKRFADKLNIDDRQMRHDFLVKFLNLAEVKIDNLAALEKDINFFEFNRFKKYLLDIIDRVFDEALRLKLITEYRKFIGDNDLDVKILKGIVNNYAKAELKKDNKLIFDPQGRLLWCSEDYIVSIDITKDTNFCDKYYAVIEEGLKDCSDKERIISALKNLSNKSSITYLQHELDMQLLLALEVYKKLFPGIKISNPKEFNKDVSLKVNKLVMQAFVAALRDESALNDDDTLNIEAVNTYLESEKSKITDLAHQILFKQCMEHNRSKKEHKNISKRP